MQIDACSRSIDHGMLQDMVFIQNCVVYVNAPATPYTTKRRVYTSWLGGIRIIDDPLKLLCCTFENIPVSIEST